MLTQLCEWEIKKTNICFHCQPKIMKRLKYWLVAFFPLNNTAICLFCQRKMLERRAMYIMFVFRLKVSLMRVNE